MGVSDGRYAAPVQHPTFYGRRVSIGSTGNSGMTFGHRRD
jgi:hypothetical protein